MTTRFRTLWLSGLHLGSAACRVQDLLGLLDRCSADSLYLVGDIVSNRSGPQRPGPARFPVADGEAWLRLTDLAQSGTRVIYLPGSGDADALRHDGQSLRGIEYRRSAAHLTASGQRLLVTSAFELDPLLRAGSDIDAYAAQSFAWLVAADVRFAALRDALGSDFSPVATGVRRRLARAREYMTRLEKALREQAMVDGFDGAICGTLHTPVCVERGGLLFASAGDWVDHRCALAEDFDGSLRLLAHDDSADHLYARPMPGNPLGSLAA